MPQGQRIPIQSSLETESNGRRISRDNNMTSSLQVQGATRVELCYISINMHFKIGTSSVKDTIKTSQIPMVLHWVNRACTCATQIGKEKI